MSTGVGMSECCLSGRLVENHHKVEDRTKNLKVHEGTPTGKIETIDDHQTYVAAPKDGSKGKSIVFLVDSKPTQSLIS